MRQWPLLVCLVLACSGGNTPAAPTPPEPGSPGPADPGPPPDIAGWWVGSFARSGSESDIWGRFEQTGSTVEGTFRGPAVDPLALFPNGYLSLSGTLTGGRFVGEFNYSHKPCSARGELAGYVDATGWSLTFYTGEVWARTYSQCLSQEQVLVLERDPSPVALLSIEFPETVVAGEEPDGRVVLSRPAPPGGLTITLSSSSPALWVPPTTTAREWDVRGRFRGASAAVEADTPVTITASDGTVTLTVQTVLRPD